MLRTLAYSVCIALMLLMSFGGSAFAITITALDELQFLNLIPDDMVGDSYDPPHIANGAQGVDGVPFFLDAYDVIDDDDDPIMVDEPFDIFLGPATGNDVNYTPKGTEPQVIADIDALLMTVTFDVSSTLDLLDVYLSEGGGAPVMLDNGTDFYLLADLGFLSGGGGMSFNPADDDLVGAFLITGTDFNADTHTDIGDFTFSVPGFDTDYVSTYRIDLFGVDQDYHYTSPPGVVDGVGGEIVSSGPNSAGGYLIPEPGSFVIIGSLLLGLAWKKRRMPARR